jgi:hypothetical protein
MTNPLLLLFTVLCTIITVSATTSFEEHAQQSTKAFEHFSLLRNLHNPNSQVIVDWASRYSVPTLQCLMSQMNFVSAIPRGYRSVGAVDFDMPSNVANAHVAGFTNIDVYMFPCPTCPKTGAEQFDELVNYIKANNVDIGMIWIDIEGPQYWKGQDFNIQFFQSILSRAVALKSNIGIYSSKYQWNSLFGAGYKTPAQYPLWYAHYDGNPSCSDWPVFGGFQKASLKQYIGDYTQFCNTDIDISSFC